MSYLLDTNVISEIRKPRPNEGVRKWIASMPGAELFISVLVIGEIRRGVEQIRTRDPHQAEVYERWLAQIDREYGDHVLRITSEVADEWGRLNAAGSLPVIDALMAATARVHHLTFVTRDVGDVARTGVPILNPFVD